MFISLVIQPSPCFSSSALAALLESFSITSVHFKILQQKAISFGSSYLLNMCYRLHDYLAYHKDTSRISTPKAAGRVLCKHCRWGRTALLWALQQERGRKQPQGRIAEEQILAPHLFLIICSSCQEEQNFCLSQVCPSPVSPFWVPSTLTNLCGISLTKLLCGRIFFLFGICIAEKGGKSRHNTRLRLALCFWFAFPPVTTKVIYPAPLFLSGRKFSSSLKFIAPYSPSRASYC